MSAYCYDLLRRATWQGVPGDRTLCGIETIRVRGPGKEKSWHGVLNTKMNSGSWS